MEAQAGNTQELFNLIGTVTSSTTASAIDTAFRRMDIAEQEIKRAMADYPERAHIIWRMFKACRSPIIEAGMPNSLFRYHVRQFLHNIAQGIDPDRPTRVEAAIMVLQGCTHAAPPPNSLSRLFLADAETCKAFGSTIEPAPAFVGEGEEWWPVLKRLCQRVYREHGIDNKTRSELVKDCLALDAPAWVYQQRGLKDAAD